MPEVIAPYACDRCQSRKVACSRQLSGCQRCRNESIDCTYSRSGVIRRNRKRKHETSSVTDQSSLSTLDRGHEHSEIPSRSLQSHLAADIAVTREQLHGTGASQHRSLDALSALSEACAAVWHDASELDQSGKTYFLFEDQTVSWIDVFVKTLKRGRPLMSPAPADVLDHLSASCPHQIRDKAWLIMYYSIILSMVSSTNPTDKSTKDKLRCNLWLALNDVRVLLEPSELNIQALVLLACHVEEFTTPSLCWMLVTNACRMLQALGVSHRRLSPETRQRRMMMFWHLNLLDQGLALIFGRPPTFHRAMSKEIALPTLNELLPFQPHVASTGLPGLFGAHYLHQIMLSSRVTADIWTCLYDDEVPDHTSIQKIMNDVYLWYRHAKEILDAAALAEKPFLDAASIVSIDLGLCTIEHQYNYLLVLITRSSDRTREQCLASSRRMLFLLGHLVSDSEEPFNGIIWQLLCCPFTPFLILFGEILSSKKAQAEGDEQNLAAMEQLPTFLNKMSIRHSLATKLERVAVVFVRHARSIVDPRELQTSGAVHDPNIPAEALPNSWSVSGHTIDWDSFFNHAMMLPTFDQVQTDACDTSIDDLAAWTNDFFGDAVIDWMGLED